MSMLYSLSTILYIVKKKVKIEAQNLSWVKWKQDNISYTFSQSSCTEFSHKLIALDLLMLQIKQW